MTTEVASIKTREIQEVETCSNDLFMGVSIPEAYRIDAKPFIERPFFVDEVDFPATATRYSLLTSTVKFLPGDIARSNASLLNMFKMGAYGRPDLYLNISMAGTITHAGTVLVAVLPPLPQYPIGEVKQLINTMLTGPHAFLNANEATSVALPVPWYCNTDLATLDMEMDDTYMSSLDITGTNGNYATLVYLVLNPLRPSTGSSTSLNIVVEACFKHFDIVVPTPRFVTWVSQSGKTKKIKTVDIAMTNPNYEYQVDTVANTKLSISKDRLKYLKYVAILSSLGICIGKSADLMLEMGVFVPQSAVLSGISGLFDMAAGGLKTIAGDAIDAGRGFVREITGLHNPNIPAITERDIIGSTNFTNATDIPQFFEKLDPYSRYNRIVKEPIFSTTEDEMALTHITAKKQFLGNFTVSSADAVGTLKWIRPISPYQGGYEASVDGFGRVSANNLELLHSYSRGWRGGLKLHIQSVMNNKQQVKLKVLKMYNPSVNARTKYPSYKSIANAPSALLEYTAGGQEQIVDLPYLCRNDICPRGELLETEAFFHGMYYIYVAQSLVVSDGSPTTIEFNVYLSGDKDLTFYGYANSNTFHSNFALFIPPVLKTTKTATKLTTKKVKLNHHKFIPARFRTDPIFKKFLEQAKYTEAEVDMLELSNKLALESVMRETGYTLANLLDPRNHALVENQYVTQLHIPKIVNWKPQASTIKVMNEPQKQEFESHGSNPEANATHSTRMLPTIDIRPLIRRMYKTSSNPLVLQSQDFEVVSIPLSSFIGENPAYWNYSPIETISRMYYGKTVGFKFRVAITSEDSTQDLTHLGFRVYYVPQNLTINYVTKTVLGSLVNTAAFPSPLELSNIGEIPFTNITLPHHSSAGQEVYEFTIPDTSYYKFMGSPNKFYNFDSNDVSPLLSTSDFGDIILQYSNKTDKTMNIVTEFYIGLTDESRFGFHAIAPPFKVEKKTSYYLGDGETAIANISATPNSYIYYGGF
jgi:hypothetical protein